MLWTGLWFFTCDQFGEQTAIKTGKGGLRGMTLSHLSWSPNGLIRSHSLSTPLVPWNTCTLKKHPTHQHRPNTKMKVKRGGDLTLVIDSGLVQSWKNIPIHYQSTLQYCQWSGSSKYWSMSAMPYLLVRRWHIHSATPFHLDSMRGMKVGNKTAFDWEIIFLRLLMVGQSRF